MEIYNRVRYLRKNILKMSQEEFAKAIEISRSNLGNIETNAVNITERNISFICKTFNVSRKWLIEGEEPIFEELSKPQKLARSVRDILSTENEFALNTFLALAELSKEEWGLLEKLANKIATK